MWTDDMQEMQLLKEDILIRGVDQPIQVVAATSDADCNFFIIDGRHRFRAAQLAKLSEVPVEERNEEDVMDVILGSLINRRHLTKGALAYVSFPIISAVVMPNGGDRTAQSIVVSAESLARDLGFSRDLYFQAKKVHELFGKRKDHKARWEADIMSGKVGLGAVIAGVAGQEATKGTQKQVSSPDSLIETSLGQLRLRFEKWNSIQPAQKEKITESMIETALSLPSDVRQNVYQALSANME